MRLLSVVTVVLASALACQPGASEGEGEGDSGEGEGEGDGSEGEGDVNTIDVQFEQDGNALDSFTLTIPPHDASTGPLTLDLGIHNLGTTPFAFLSEPPLLVAGANADLFSIAQQPPGAVDAGATVPFQLRYAPITAGTHQGKVLFAYGVTAEERIILTVNATATGQGALPGVNASIYDQSFDVLPDFSTLTPVETAVVHNFDISAREPDPAVDTRDNFAFLFEGFVLTPGAGGDFSFFLNSDDGSRLLIDGALVVDNDGLHGAVTEATGLVTLTAGSHAIRVEYFEKTGGAELRVSWLGPGVPKAPIPDNALFTSAP